MNYIFATLTQLFAQEEVFKKVFEPKIRSPMYSTFRGDFMRQFYFSAKICVRQTIIDSSI